MPDTVSDAMTCTPRVNYFPSKAGFLFQQPASLSAGSLLCSELFHIFKDLAQCFIESEANNSQMLSKDEKGGTFINQLKVK